MQSIDKGRALAWEIFANEADPAFRRRAAWIGSHLSRRFDGRPFEVLDIGCGRGFYFPLFHALGAGVSGVESDPLPLVEARRRAAEIGAAVADASAERLPFPDARFDAVVMSEILEHLPSPGTVLTEAHRVLAPGGLLLVTVPNANYPFLWDPLNWLLERTTGRPIRRGTLAGIWANHVRLYDRAALVSEIEGAGFAVEEVVFHTHRSLPFVHNLVYGLGKPLLEKRLLPAGWARSAERAAGRPAAKRRLDPVAAGIRLIHWFDRNNADADAESVPTVNICVAARRR